MALQEYLVKVSGQKSNICFDCRNACGKCPWSEYDPDKDEPRFQPVPGWTARKVILNVGTNGKKHMCLVETYHITACPMFVKDEKRKDDFMSLTDEQWAALMKKWRVWGWY